ncbi:MAG: HD domain-containing protein [Oscillospiraceae bacterium]
MKNNGIVSQKTKTYTYEPVFHPAYLNNKSEVYCRMANDILEFDSQRCYDCPLWNDEGDVACCYYDFNDAKEYSPNEAKRHAEGMIKLGISNEFPEFIDGGFWTEDALVYEKALQFAAKAHKGAYRKGTKIPYIVHPVEASMIALRLYKEIKPDSNMGLYEIAAAAALHDVVEDTKYTISDIEQEFGDNIAELVRHESENKRENIPASESWRIRKEETLNHLLNAPVEAKMIAMGDKLSNMRSMAKDYRGSGDKMWDKFNMKDKNAHKWYYKSLIDIFRCFCETAAYKEYVKLCDEVFGKHFT